MQRKLLPWFLFALCVALFGLASTPFGHIADSVLIALKLIALIFLSVLVVRSGLRKRSASPASSNGRISDRGESILRSFTRWCRGEHGSI